MFGEFRMLQSNYSAEYGRVGGGIEIYVSKSGTNDVHGAAFHNMRRDIWNANAWARNAARTRRRAPRQRSASTKPAARSADPSCIPKIYDGRNKTFWFFTYTKDDYRPIRSASQVSTLCRPPQ